MKIAVVGAGISGLSAAWLLSKRHDVVLYERNEYIGGHSNTAEVCDESGHRIPVDTGFVVYNADCYPNLVALFDYLSVPTAETEMSFSVSMNSGDYEYSGNGLSGLFAQRRNLFNSSHWVMTAEILRFFREVSELEVSSLDPHCSLGSWLAANRYSDFFIQRHILPMGAAIWSTPAETMLAFPLAAFTRFFSNHGLLIANVNKRPIWRTVRGGSRQYVDRLLRDFRGTFAMNAPVISICRKPRHVAIEIADGGIERFDHCVVATHADEALKLISDTDDLERGLLGAFSYADNTAILHTDARVMPRRQRAWASWNYTGDESGNRLSVTYWMNRLQPLESSNDYFVTLNPSHQLPEERVLKRMHYQHPIFDARAMTAQRDLWSLQGRRRTWFAGSYFGYGFHEDGLQSGLAVAEDLGGVKRPWTLADERDRILSPAAHRGAAVAAAAE